MKKSLKIMLLAMLLILPFGVYAKEDVSITSATLINSDGFVEGFNNPTIDGLNLAVNGKFTEIGDNVTYQVNLKNEGTEDYTFKAYIDKVKSSGGTITPGMDQKDNYISYGLLCEGRNGNSNTFTDVYVLKANTTTTCNLTIAYYNEIPDRALTNGRYIDDVSYDFKLLNEKETAQALAASTNSKNDTKAANNPKTNNNLIIVIVLGLIVISGLAVVVVSRKNKKLGKIVSVIAIVALPLTVFAASNVTLVVKGQITIEPTYRFCYYDISTDFNGLDATYHEYEKGMTWRQFLNSDLNDNFVAASVSNGQITETQPSGIAGGFNINSIGYPHHGRCNGECGSYATSFIESLDDEIISNRAGCYTWQDVGSHTGGN